jgi:hypothetical protein
MSFMVCEKPCDQCLFSKDRIVSAERVREILAECERDDVHFTCHKATIAGRDVCCRTFYDTRTSKSIRFAEWLGLEPKFVDPATGRPFAPSTNGTTSQSGEEA